MKFELVFEFANFGSVDVSRIKLIHVDSTLNHTNDFWVGIVMFTNVVTNNFTDADNSVTTCHDLAVTVNAIESMHCSDNWAFAFFVREMCQPGRDSTSSMDNVRINRFNQFGKFAVSERGSDNVLRTNI